MDADKKDKRKEPSLERDSEQMGVISGTGVTWTYDSTDHPLIPRNGLKSRLELEFVGLGGIAEYLGFGYYNGYFHPWGNSGVIKLRADFRFLLPFGKTSPAGKNGIPYDERLFLGGDSLVRGYRSYRLGPLYKERGGEKSDDPRGGISLQYYSAEYAYKFHDKLEAFVFADAGYLTLHRANIGKPYVSVGFGTRLQIIDAIPAITMGLGFPLNAKKSTQVKNFFFSMGGKF